ncbi:hypothetical protein MCOR27_002077 [Pyricularia oryzae]|uniref:ditrans,polycis-polyprenyl diphosphate synthase [(2E,6E)-farnesyldiphosphate specific] n=5 Tax=Pyricularia TaxID=48558 RepID=A0ABQ8NLM1_PYRGI|nr:uncharacterized protein MGG_04560 [Pyricularia oryzae 70-15]ELQ32997.1 hypothetical protein OOU_Y34scaffold01005g21 [Pyricularia oryzae Y34]KAH8844877.1 hypothetical protein MCOR01_002141 [Pyricularia oryzae]KAI6299013.1 hypothetical protein MCOR33_004959 [Pyricularia grisea]EHA58308.1 hypothetical protein MGG_04560 [Pyricularia oryzae 70-15]KAH9429271.1 hypothetical protein MCOR02_010677 [Pyricularia oryzae]
MPVKAADSIRYRADEKAQGKLLTAKERLKLIEPYLPERPADREQRVRRKSVLGVRRFLANQLYLFVYVLIHTVFSLYIRSRQVYHFCKDRTRSILSYHHRTPEIIEGDIKKLGRTPKHLSVILRLEEDSGRAGAELERLVNEVADIAAWCACAGIPKLSVYEKTGILKGYLQKTHRAVSAKLASYYGDSHPALIVKAPHTPSIESDPSAESGSGDKHIIVLLLSAEDGRDSLVDLTKTLTEMAQAEKLSPTDINMDVIDTELTESVMDEPDLLIHFGPHVVLDGYPPWQIRLTEIYHAQDNNSVGYQVFLRGLQNYSRAQFRNGK